MADPAAWMIVRHNLNSAMLRALLTIKSANDAIHRPLLVAISASSPAVGTSCLPCSAGSYFSSTGKCRSVYCALFVWVWCEQVCCRTLAITQSS